MITATVTATDGDRAQQPRSIRAESPCKTTSFELCPSCDELTRRPAPVFDGALGDSTSTDADAARQSSGESVVSCHRCQYTFCCDCAQTAHERHACRAKTPEHDTTDDGGGGGANVACHPPPGEYAADALIAINNFPASMICAMTRAFASAADKMMRKRIGECALRRLAATAIANKPPTAATHVQPPPTTRDVVEQIRDTRDVVLAMRREVEAEVAAAVVPRMAKEVARRLTRVFCGDAEAASAVMAQASARANKSHAGAGTNFADFCRQVTLAATAYVAAGVAQLMAPREAGADSESRRAARRRDCIDSLSDVIDALAPAHFLVTRRLCEAMAALARPPSSPPPPSSKSPQTDVLVFDRRAAQRLLNAILSLVVHAKYGAKAVCDVAHVQQYDPVSKSYLSAFKLVVRNAVWSSRAATARSTQAPDSPRKTATTVSQHSSPLSRSFEVRRDAVDVDAMDASPPPPSRPQPVAPDSEKRESRPAAAENATATSSVLAARRAKKRGHTDSDRQSARDATRRRPIGETSKRAKTRGRRGDSDGDNEAVGALLALSHALVPATIASGV